MGVQTMGVQGNGQHYSHEHPYFLEPQKSCYNLTLNEVENQLGKPLGSMNLDEILNNLWSTEENQSTGVDDMNTSSPFSFRRQASLSLARSLSGKTLDQVCKEIQHGYSKRLGDKMKIEDTQSAFGEITLEDFLVQAGLFAEAIPLAMEMDSVDVMTLESFSQQMVLSPMGVVSDTTTLGQKRYTPDATEKTIDRRLKRKIKNRESAARSRARKQAYHDELVSKISRLEMVNIRLKKEKEFDKMMPCETSPEKRYQLRRTDKFSLLLIALYLHCSLI